jgi:lipoprotein NlpI
MNLLGLVYWKMENYESAVEQYDQAIELDPDYVWPHYNRGLANRDASN